MRKTIYFDIDGTVADLKHRLHHISGHSKDWKSFNAGIPLDKPIEQTIWLNKILAEFGDVNIVFCSGRSEDERVATETWLRTQGIYWDKLYMRKSGDYRADYIIKKELLAQMRSEGFDPFLAYDDRQTVTDALREEGVFVLQCDPNRGECGSDVYQFHPDISWPLTIMVGPAGAGKSSLVKEFYSDRTVISTDLIRASICADFEDQTQNNRVHQIKLEMADKALKLGLPVVIDATNIRRKDRVECVKLLPQHIPVRYIVVNRSLEDKIASKGHRTEELIRKHDQVFRSNLKEILAGDGFDNVCILDTRKVK